SSLLPRSRLSEAGAGWPCHFATVSRSRPRRRAMLDTDTPSSLKTWIWLHCCIVITSAASSCDDVGVAAEGRAASAAVTNAGFLAIPRYKCGFLGDHFCWFSMITSAGFHPIRDTLGRCTVSEDPAGALDPSETRAKVLFTVRRPSTSVTVAALGGAR